MLIGNRKYQLHNEAIKKGNFKLYRQLISEIKHDINLFIPLHVAIGYNQIEIVKDLLAMPSIDPNHKDEYSNSPLQEALTFWLYEPNDEEVRLPIIKLLLSRGVNVNQLNDRHMTALHMAIYNRVFNIARCLIEYGADPSISNLSGYDAYDLAKVYYDKEFIEWLGNRVDIKEPGIN